MIDPSLVPDIKFGHLVQAGVLIASAAGGILGAYLACAAISTRSAPSSASQSPGMRRGSSPPSACSTSGTARTASSRAKCARHSTA